MGCGGGGGIVGDDNNNGNNDGGGDDGGGDITVVEPEVGKPLPDWSEGCLDIHAINTGRGESSLLIFPDGTTMLIDAASSTIDENDDIPPPPLKPAGSDPATTITNYVTHYIKAASGKLNYMMISHWHNDHVGGPPNTATMEIHPSREFILCGATRVGTSIRVDKFIDRGTTYPKDMASASSAVYNYMKFVNWAKTEYGSTREEAVVGVTDQIVLKEYPKKYSKFTIRTFMSAGTVWTGAGTVTRNTFPADINQVLAASFDENKYSIAFHLKYGLFDFFTGGDLSYSNSSKWSWYNVETPVAALMPKVEVMKANHHGTGDCNSDLLLKAAKPDAVIIHTWRDVQPNLATVKRMFAASPDCNIFTTNMTEKNKKVLGASVTAQLRSMGGHTVVRVDPGGGQYNIYVLDDTDENYVVQKIFGPYQCK